MVPLTQGKVALVDNEDFELVRRFKWYAVKHHSGLWYARAKVPGSKDSDRHIKMHRLIMNPKPEEHVDHVSGDGLNNTRANLRCCTNAQNQANTKSRGGSSQFKGVYFDRRKSKWKAAIMHQRRYYSLGSYVTEIEAAQAANEGYRWLKGSFARLNNVPPRRYNAV